MEIGGYTITRELGRGGMGVVYEAVDPSTQLKVALKTVLLEEGRPRERARIRMEREAAALARLSHPGLVPCHAAGETPQGFFMVMGLVEGESVGEQLRTQGRFPIARALQIMGDVAEVLAYIHSQGYLHRDLKPDNVMLSSSGRTVVADFGMVKLTDAAVDSGSSPHNNLTRTGAMLGTPGFCSPEQALGKEVGPPSDVYGWAATLYCLLCEQPPRDVSSMQAFMLSLHRPAKSIREHRSDVPLWLDQLLSDCLSRDPTRRPDLELVRRSVSSAGAPRVGPSQTLKWAAVTLALAAVASVLAVTLLVQVDGQPSASTAAIATPTAPADSPQPAGPGAEVFALLAENRPLQAAERAEAWLREEPGSVKARVACADAHLRSMNTRAALPHALAAIEHELPAEGWAICGRVLLAAREVTRASECLERARALEPDDLQTLFLGAQVALLGHEFEQSLALYTRSIALEPTAHAYANRAWAREQLPNPNYEEVLKDAERALKLEPRSLEARRIYAHVISRRFDPKRGERLLRELLADFPNDSSAIKDLALLLKAQGRKRELREFLSRPEVNEPTALFMLGQMYFEAKQLDEAENVFNAVINAGAGMLPEAHFMRGWVRQDRQQHRLALEDFSYTLSNDPGGPFERLSLERRVFSLRALRDYDAAFHDVEALLKLSPDDLRVHRQKLEVLYLGKQTAAAARFAPTYLARLGENPGEAGALPWFAIAAHAGLTGKSEEAERAYSKAISYKDNALSRMLRGTHRVKFERYEDALGDLRLAVELEPTLGQAWGGLMRAYHALNQPTEARQAARRYLQLGERKHAALAREILGQ